MKYSIIYPYYKRPDHTACTLNSLIKLYPERLDYEIIFVVDLKNTESDRIEFFNVLEKFWYKIRLIVAPNDIYSYSSARPYNIGADRATGEFLVLSNPECLHKSDILAGFDFEFERDKDAYVVCACESTDTNGKFIEWYQHSVNINRKLHFCSAIAKNNYLKLKGFDEDYVLGLSYEDNDWIEKVEKSYKIVVRDDLLVSHREHSRSYHHDELHGRALHEKNACLLNKKRDSRN